MAIKVATKFVQEIKYIPLGERAEDVKTSFTLKTLDYKTLSQLDDGLTSVGSDNQVSLKTGTYNRMALKHALQGWENFLDFDTGKEIKFKVDGNGTASDESLGYIPAELRNELASVVLEASRNPEKIKDFLGDGS